MGKIYTERDMVEAISKVEELATINAELEELLYRGSNDEKLIERKRELQSSVRKLKLSDSDEPIKIEQDEDLISLKADFNFVVSRYKARKLKLEAEITIYKNGG